MATSVYGADEARPLIGVFLEHEEGRLKSVSLELLARARQLATEAGWKLVGLLLGHGLDALGDEAVAHGADVVWLADDPLLARFSVDAYAHVVGEALLAEKPAAFLLGATPDGRDLAGRLAVRLRTGLNADCTQLHLDAARGVLVCEVSGFGGGVLALIEMPAARPQMATVRPGVFRPGEPDARRSGGVRQFPATLTPDMVHTRQVERVTGAGLDLTQAEVLVIGGRGVGERWDLVREIAALLGGEVGATRPPVDEGHVSRERQIGQTGVVCRPKVALVCGASGAFHFVVGIQDADLVIAINSDPEAPIFDYADYCLVGDAMEILPALRAALTGEVAYA